MTQAFIVTGPQNSGLGDNPVVAGNKINSNFNDLYAATSFGLVGNVLNYGASPTPGYDNRASLQAAASLGIPLFFPPGTYTSSETIQFTNSIFGLNAAETVLACTNGASPVATIQGSNLLAADLTFFHPITPSAGSGGHGLVVLAGSAQTKVTHCQAHYNDRGIVVNLGTTSIWIEDNVCGNNAGSGFLLTDPNYFVRGNISISNGIYGYECLATIGNAQNGLQMSDNLSYANANNGYNFIGTAGGTLDDLFLSNNISSYDVGNGYYFDTYGINIQLSNCYAEFSGYVGGSIYSNSSVGYSFSAHNQSVSLNGSQAYQCTASGVYNSGADLTISGGKYNSNGQGSSGGYSIGGTSAGFTNVTGANLTTFTDGTHGPSNITAGYGSFSNCAGYQLRSSGYTASVTSATTNIAHGLAATPSYVILQPMNGTPSAFYPSTIGGTYFQITFTGGGAQPFSWSAVAPTGA